jgi:hypothetical protein
VRNGDSGLSVGRIQMDLSKHKDLADRLVAIGKANGVAGAEEITADMLKQTHEAFKDRNGRYNEVQIAKIEKFAAGVLNTKEGESALENAERGQVRTVAAKVEEACGQSGPNAQKFCASPQGQRELAAYIHQYGTGKIDELKAYLRGEVVTLGKGGKDADGTKVQLTQELTPESFRSDYRNTTLYAQKNPVPIATRDKNVDAADARWLRTCARKSRAGSFRAQIRPWAVPRLCDPARQRRGALRKPRGCRGRLVGACGSQRGGDVPGLSQRRARQSAAACALRRPEARRLDRAEDD